MYLSILMAHGCGKLIFANGDLYIYFSAFIPVTNVFFRVLILRSRDRWFEPQQRHCVVSLS